MEHETGVNHNGTMNWGAIIGGWVVAMGMVSMMYAGGLAVGYTWTESSDAAAVARGIGPGTAIWMVATWGVSLFVGGLFASWFDGNNDQTVGTLHGVTVWGLAITACSLLTMGRISRMLSGGWIASNGSNTVAMAMCIVFITILVSLLAAAAGGWLGAGHIHKVHHLRRYPARPSGPL